MIDVITLGKRLRDIRIRCGITQKEVAAELKVTQSAVSKVECGGVVVSPILLKFLSYYMTQVNIDVLLSDEWELIGDDDRLFNKNVEINSVAAEKVKMLREDIDKSLKKTEQEIKRTLNRVIDLVSVK